MRRVLLVHRSGRADWVRVWIRPWVHGVMVDGFWDVVGMRLVVRVGSWR